MVPDWLPSLLSTIAFHVSIIIFPSFYLLHQVDSKRNCCNGKMATDRPTPNPQKQTNKQTKETKRKKKLGKKTRPDEKEKKGVEWSARHNDTGRPIPSAPINRPIDRSINRRVNGKSRRGVGRGLGRPGVCLRPECLPTYG